MLSLTEMTIIVSSRRNRDEGLNTSILEDGEEHDEPESEREMSNGLQAKRSTLLANMTFSTGLVCHIIDPTEVAIEEKHGYSTEEREQSNCCTDPQSECIGSEIPSDDVGSRLTSELRQVGYAPI